jgi:hypothetical protein
LGHRKARNMRSGPGEVKRRQSGLHREARPRALPPRPPVKVEPLHSIQIAGSQGIRPWWDPRGQRALVGFQGQSPWPSSAAPQHVADRSGHR